MWPTPARRRCCGLPISPGLACASDSTPLLTQRPDGWVAVLPLRGVTDASSVATALHDLGLQSVHLLDLKQETQALYRGYRDQALHFALLGAAAIVLVAACQLAHPAARR